MIELQIRQAVATDLEIISTLYYEMEIHYEKEGAVSREIIQERLNIALFSQAAVSKMYLAFFAGELAGFAITVPLFSAQHATIGLYLGDLFTTAKWRGRGIGRALLAHLAKVVTEEGYSRLDWMTEADNQGARKLYESITRQSNKVHYRLEGQALRNLAENISL